MDQNGKTISFEERQMEQLLSSLQGLLLSTSGDPGVPETPADPGGSSDHQNPANNSPRSEFDVIDPEVAAAELNHVLSQLAWQQNIPAEENCPFMWNYFNATVQILADLHMEHSRRPVETRKRLLHRHHRIQQSPSSSDTSFGYLFHCATCCDMITTLYERFNPDLCNHSRELQDALPELPNPFLGQATSSQIWQTSIPQPQRPSSPIPNLPSTSRQYYFGETPSRSVGVGSTSPVPNLPSTSRNFNFSGASQSSPNLPPQMTPVNNPQPRTESPNDVERIRRILRLKRERHLHQRRRRR